MREINGAQGRQQGVIKEFLNMPSLNGTINVAGVDYPDIMHASGFSPVCDKLVLDHH